MSRRRCFGFFLTIILLSVLPLLVRAESIIKTLGITLVDTTDFPSTQVYFSVNDVDGLPVSDLQEGDLQLYEDDVPVANFEVTPVENPLLIGVVIDSAVSFRTREGGATRVEHAKEVARWLVAPQYGRLSLDDQVAIYAFQAGQPVRLVDFTHDHQRVLDQGIALVSTEGNSYTALFDILRQAIGETSVRAGARRRALMVFSDGVDRTSAADVERVIQQAQEAHLLIYTVGLGADLAPDRPGSAFLRRLADETGGQYLWYRPGRPGADEPVLELLNALAEQRKGYRITYSSNQYQGNPRLRLVTRRLGAQAEDRATFEVPPLPPVVTVDTIKPGEILAGSITVQPSIARTQRELERVEYRIDDQLVFTARSAPWAFEWDTREYASSAIEYEELSLSVVACDLAQQCSEPYALQLGVRLPQPTPTPSPVVVSETVDSGMGTVLSALSLVVSLAALVLIVIYMRRGGGQAVGRVVQEVRRKTRVWMNQTKIFGAGGGGSNHVPTLSVASDAHKGERFPLTGRVLFLGRDAERADLVFEWDDYISRRHAKIAQEGEQWYIWDMNSANRTWLNQELVRASLSEGLDLEEAVPLHDGDMLKMGPELTLRFELPAVNGIHSQSEESSEAVDLTTPTRVVASAPVSSASQVNPETDSENVETLMLNR